MYHRPGDRFNFVPPSSAVNSNNNTNQVRRYPANNKNINYWRPSSTNNRINNQYIRSWNGKNIGFGYPSFSHSMHYGFQTSDNQKIINILPVAPLHHTSHNNSGYFRVPLRKPFNNYQKTKPGVKISTKSKAKLLKRSKMQRLKATNKRTTNAQSSKQQNNFKHNPPKKRAARKSRWKKIDLKSNKTRNVSSRFTAQQKPNLTDPTSSTALVSAWLTNNFETPFSSTFSKRSFSSETIDNSTDAVVPLYAAGCPSDLRNVEHGATSFTLPDNISMWSGMESCSLVESQELQHSKPANFGKLLTTESLLQLEKEELVALVLSLQKQVLSDNNRTCRVSNSSTVQSSLPDNERANAYPSDTMESNPSSYPEPSCSRLSVKADPELLVSNCADVTPPMTETTTAVSGIKQETQSLC